MSDYARMRKAQQMGLAIKVRPHVRKGRPVKGHTRHLAFSSGANSAAQARGFIMAKHPVGIAVDQVSEGALRELEETAGSGLQVFVDSGAFGEVNRDLTVKKPITHEEWVRRLGIYGRLARALGPDVHLVAPDRVGDSAETLRRQKRYMPELRKLAATGATILVPLQGRDTETLVQSHRAVAKLFGDVPWVPGIPSKKGATPTGALHGYLAEVKPPRIHLLGLGLKNPRWRRRNGKPGDLQMMMQRHPATIPQFDSVLMLAAAGKTGGVGGGPRPMTLNRQKAMERIGETMRRDTDTPLSPDGPGVDYTDLIGSPSEWLSRAGRKAVAQAADLTEEQARAFVQDPEAWMDADPFHAALVEFELDGAWARWFERAVGGAATVEAILNTWGDDGGDG